MSYALFYANLGRDQSLITRRYNFLSGSVLERRLWQLRSKSCLNGNPDPVNIPLRLEPGSGEMRALQITLFRRATAQCAISWLQGRKETFGMVTFS